MKIILILSIFIGCAYSQMSAQLQAMLAKALQSSAPSASSLPKIPGVSPKLPGTSSYPSYLGGISPDILAKLQLPATKTKAFAAAATAPTPTTTTANPFETLMFLKATGAGGGGLLPGGLANNPLKMMMMQQMFSGGGGGGGGGRGGRGGSGGMGGGGFLRTTIQFRLCDEAELTRIPCMMCDMESFKRFKMPYKFFTCNPMMPRYLPPSMKFGCCYKDMRAMMLAKQIAAR